MRSVINELYGNDKDYEDNMFSVFFFLVIIYMLVL